MLQALRPLHRAWKGLGLTPTTYSAGKDVIHWRKYGFADLPQNYWRSLTLHNAAATLPGPRNILPT